jgi:IS30 family transposase
LLWERQFRQAEQQNKWIAEIVGVHASTISLVLKRNQGKTGYRPRQANQKAQGRKHGVKKRIEVTAGIHIRIRGFSSKAFDYDVLSQK